MDEVQSGNELGDEFNRGRATSRRKIWETNSLSRV